MKLFKFVLFLILIALFYGAAICAATFLKTNGESYFDLEYITAMETIVVFIVLVSIMALVVMFKAMDGKTKKKKSKGLSDKGKDEHGNEVKQYFSNDFISLKELETNPDFNYTTLKNIRNVKKDGILVRAEVKNKDVHINFIKPIHTLIIGTTSSGKSTSFIEPTMQILSMTAAKPSFVITDPKFELYERESEKLRKEGYEVICLELKNPFSSAQWNPLSHAYDTYHRAFALEKEVKVHPSGDDPSKYILMKEQDFDFWPWK